MIDKNKALGIANLINDVSNGEVLFVGGISQLIRGYKDEIKDIDIIVKNVNTHQLKIHLQKEERLIILKTWNS